MREDIIKPSEKQIAKLIEMADAIQQILILVHKLSVPSIAEDVIGISHQALQQRIDRKKKKEGRL